MAHVFKRFTSTILLISILLAAFIIRFYKLSEIPASLNPDEAALGYTAYSFLHTGADEHGKFLPLTLQSFGDGKLPVYSYIDMIPIAVLGLTETAVRLPSAIAGVIGVLFLYLISLKLFGKRSVAFLAAFFFFLSPWSIYFSRAAYEVNVGTTIFLIAFYLLLQYFHKQQTKHWYFFVSVFLFGVTVFTHHTFIVFTPLFCLGFFILKRRDIQFTKIVEGGILLFAFIIFIAIFTTVSEESNKVSTLFVFNDRNVLYNRVEVLRGDNAPKNMLIEKLLHTKYLGVSYQIAQNYLNSFSPAFLFDKGGEKLVHGLGYFGNLYVFDSLLLVCGFAWLLRYRHKAIQYLFLWLLLAPLPSAVTRDAPNATRLFTLLPLFCIVSAIGAYALLTYFQGKKVAKRIVICFLVFLFIFNVLYFLDGYFAHFNTQRARFWSYGYREAVFVSDSYKNYHVVVRGPENFPYIYFLFYERYDPRKFVSSVSYYPPTNEGFLFVKQFDRYEFVNKIDYSNLEAKTLYIDDLNLAGKAKNYIYLPSGEPILAYFTKNSQ